MKSCRRNRTLLGIANAFSGGIFLAIALLHIIPEAHTHYLVYLHKDAAHDDPVNFSHIPEVHSASVSLNTGGGPVHLGGNHHRGLHGIDNVHEFLELGFPLPYFMVFIGYTLILLIDKVMFDSHSLVHGHEHNPIRESFRKSLMSRNPSNSNIDLKSNPKSDQETFEDQKNYSEFKDEGDHGEDNDDGISEGIRQYLSKADRFSAKMNSALSQKYKKGSKRSMGSIQKSKTGDVPNTGPFVRHDDLLKENTELSDGLPRRKRGCDLTPYVLMIALSVHSVFEGVAVGLQDDVADIWSFLIAIGTHKWAAAMSLGISMGNNLDHSPTTVKILILIFALATPIGVIFGMIVMEAAPLINIIFSGLAGGTFLYISASEVVVEEFSIPDKKWIKLAGFILGAMLITLITGMESE